MSPQQNLAQMLFPIGIGLERGTESYKLRICENMMSPLRKAPSHPICNCSELREPLNHILQFRLLSLPFCGSCSYFSVDSSNWPDDWPQRSVGRCKLMSTSRCGAAAPLDAKRHAIPSRNFFIRYTNIHSRGSIVRQVSTSQL